MGQMPRRRHVAFADTQDRLALREEVIGEVFEYLCDRLPQYRWITEEVVVDGWPLVAFGGRHCAVERFVCLAIDRRVIECAAGEPAQLLHRLDLARVDAALDEGEGARLVTVGLD
jgi:hypothetical protein